MINAAKATTNANVDKNRRSEGPLQNIVNCTALSILHLVAKKVRHAERTREASALAIQPEILRE